MACKEAMTFKNVCTYETDKVAVSTCIINSNIQ